MGVLAPKLDYNFLQTRVNFVCVEFFRHFSLLLKASHLWLMTSKDEGKKGEQENEHILVVEDNVSMCQVRVMGQSFSKQLKCMQSFQTQFVETRKVEGKGVRILSCLYIKKETTKRQSRRRK
jgi:hypothetical protein